MGTSMGAGVVISRYFGARDADNISRAVHTNIAFACEQRYTDRFRCCVHPDFLRWMKTDPSVLPQATEYFRYYFLGAIAMIMYNVCRGIMNAVGDSRRPLYYLIFFVRSGTSGSMAFCRRVQVGAFGRLPSQRSYLSVAARRFELYSADEKRDSRFFCAKYVLIKT